MNNIFIVEIKSLGEGTEEGRFKKVLTTEQSLTCKEDKDSPKKWLERERERERLLYLQLEHFNASLTY